MKKGKWAVLSVIAAAMCPIAVACSDNTKPGHEHTYEGQQWVITTMPTETTGGVASRDCVDNDYTDTKQLPNLKDTSFWAVDDDKSTPAGHGTPGKTVYTSEYGDVEVPILAKDHTYGDWDITLDPTWDETGSATRVCTEDQHPDTVTVEKLSDTSVWTKDTEHSVEAGCTTGGKDVYKSKYGTVEIVIPAPGHSPTGGWTVTQEPTATTGGKSTSACANCDDTIEKDLPSFEDTEFWTHTHAVADYNHGTQDTYTSDFGTVVKEANDKIPAPYDNKTYFGICFDTEKAGGDPIDSYGANMSITLDAKGAAESGNFLFGGSGSIFHIRMDDFAKGLITLENTKGEEHSEQAAYLDTESGIFVRIANKYVWAFTPFETDTEGAPYKTTKASHWTVDNKTAIVATYTSPASNDSKAYNIFVYGNKAYFGVKFASDKAGTSSLAAEACYNAQYVYVFDKDDEMIAAFAYDGEKMVETDGLEGAYTGTLDGASVTLNVSGHGAFTGDNAGTYTVAADGASYTLDAYIDGKYFEITLTGNEFTAVKPMVKVTLESDYDTETVGDPEKNVNKNIVMVLPELSDEAQHFGGWFFDAACTQPVPAQFKPTENVTLHAKWAQKVAITLHIDADDSSTIYLGVGDVIGTKLPELGVEVANNRYFVGWYTDAGCTTPLRTNAAVTAAQNGSTVYAKWETLPAYYGEYHGYQLLSGTTEKTIELSIDEHGDIEGSYIGSSGSSAVTIAGRVTAFDKELGVITWQRTGFDGVYRMWVDDGVVLIAVPENTQSSTELGTYPYMLTKGSTSLITGSTHLGFHNGASTSQWYTYLVSYGTANKLAFVYNSKIYADVTVTDAFGTNIATIDAVNASKTIVVKDSTGSVIVKFGTTADKMTDTKDTIGGDAVRKPIDDYAGKYTIGGTEYSLNGIGDIVWNGLGEGVTATYAFVKEEGDFFVFDVFTRTIKLTPVSGGSSSGDYGDGEYGDYDYEDDDDVTYNKEYVNKEYFVLKIAKPETSGTSSFEKIMKELKYNVNLPADAENATVADETESKNAKIEFVLSKEYDIDAVGNYVFAGWYDNEACTGDELTKLTITDDKEVFAKWVEKLTVTLHINFEGENELAPVYVGKGFVAEIDEPTIEGLSFMGWFTNAGCTDVWDSSAPLTADVDLYAKWGTPAYMHNYSVLFISENSTAGTDGIDKRSGTIRFNANGTSTSESWPFNGYETTIKEFDDETGFFVIDTKSSQVGVGEHKGCLDFVTGTIVLNANIGRDSEYSKAFILVKTENFDNITSASYSESYWNNGETRAVQFAYDSSTTMSILIHKGVAYFGVTFKTAAGEDVAGKDCYTSPTLYVRSSDGTLIAKFGYDGTTMNELDGYEDITYAGSLGNVSVDGVKVVTVDDKTGSYSLASDADYTADVYVDGSYYEITFDKAAATYTAVKRMVTLNYATDYDVAHAVSGQVNKNIGVELPVLTDATHIFRGWFTDEQGTLPVAVVEGKFIPTEATTTLYAKWDKKVTLTLNYGKDISQRAVEFGEGDDIDLDDYKPIAMYLDGQVFVGWSETEGGTTAIDLTTIDADKTLYAIWETKDPYTISGVGTAYTEFSYDKSTNTYTSNNHNVSSTNSVMTFTANAPGTLSLQYFSSGESSYDNLQIKLNNSVYKNETGQIIRVEGENGLSEGQTPGENDWMSLTQELNAGDVIYIIRGKDSSNDKGADKAWIRNLVFIPFDMSIAGEYTCDGESNITLNGKGVITRGTETGTYEAIVGQEKTYDVFFNDQTGKKISHHRLVIDSTGNTYTLTDVKVAIAYNMNGHGSAISNVDVYTGIEYSLPSAGIVTDDNWVFKGWYDNAGCTGSPAITVTPDDGKEYIFYAKWVQKVTLTVVLGNGLDTLEAVYGAGDGLNLDEFIPPMTNSQIFDGWCADEELDIPFTATTINADMLVYAKWREVHALMGVYKGFEFDSSSLASSLRTTTVDENGKVTATGSYSTFSAKDIIYDENTGAFVIGTTSSGRYGYYDAQTQTIVYTYSESETNAIKLNNDVFVCIKADNVTSASSPNYVYWTDDSLTVSYVKLGKFKVNDIEKYFFVYDNKVFGDVTVSALNASGQAVTVMSDFKKEGVMLTISRKNAQLFKGVYKGSTFVTADGLASTYSGEYGTIDVDGYGSLKVDGGESIAYSVVEGRKITFVNNNRMYVVTLAEDDTYEKTLDGHEGTYSLPEGDTIVIDGYGGAGDGKTYVVNNTTITVYDGAQSISYGLDKANMRFLGKSVLANMTFENSSVKSITFDDVPELKGTILLGYSSWYAEFTGTLDGNTLTITVTKDVGNNSSVGDTLVFTYDEAAGTLTIASGTGIIISSGYASVGTVYTKK